MVSYLSLFRRYQKPLLAGLGVFAMLGFVVFPILQDFLMTRQQMGEPGRRVIAKYDGGEFSYAAVENYRVQHVRSAQFLNALATEVMKRGGLPRVPGFRANPQNNQIFALGIPAMLSEQGVISSKLGAMEAQKLGLTVDREFVDEWLKAYTDGKLSGAEIDKIFRETTGGELQELQFYNVLTTELAAGLVGRIGYGGMATGKGDILSTPGQLWDDFRKVAETARVTAYPVLVADYVDKAPATFTEAEIRELFNKGRDRFADPDSPDPGFRRRYSADVEFVRVELQPFIDQAKAALTDEQVRAEYDRQVADGLWRTPNTPPTTPPAPAGDATAPNAGDAANPSDAADAPVDESTVENEPAAPVDPEPAATDQPSEATAPQDPVAPQTEPQSAVGSPRAVRLVDYQAPTQPPAEDAADTSTGQVAEAVETGDVGQTPVDENAAPPRVDAAAPGSDPSEVESANATADSPESPASQPPTIATGEGPVNPSAISPNTRVQTFDEVKDQVREQMALQPARDAMRQVIDKIRKEMRGFAQKHARYLAQKREQADVEAPARLNLQQIAESYGVKFGQTGMVDALSVGSLPISRSASFTDAGFMRFNQMVFNQDVNDFQIQESQDFTDGATYVFWRTESRDDYTPKLEDVREEVISFLRLKAARELARKEAEALAKRANEQPDRPLAELVPENRANLVLTEVGPFSWFTLVSQLNGQPVISEVPELDRVGDEFMRAVFGDNRDRWQVAGNAPLNTYYVLRGSDFQPGLEELQKQFRETGRRLAGTTVGQDRVSAMYRAWQRSITDRIGLELEPL